MYSMYIKARLPSSFESEITILCLQRIISDVPISYFPNFTSKIFFDALTLEM